MFVSCEIVLFFFLFEWGQSKKYLGFVNDYFEIKLVRENIITALVMNSATVSLCSYPSWIFLGCVRTAHPLLKCQVASKEYRSLTRRT